jgi:hypothetical protein
VSNLAVPITISPSFGEYIAVLLPKVIEPGGRTLNVCPDILVSPLKTESPASFTWNPEGHINPSYTHYLV